MKKILFTLVLILFTVCMAQGVVDTLPDEVELSDVELNQAIDVVRDGKGNIEIVKTLIESIKAGGGWKYVTANIILLLSIVVGLSRWIAKALVILLSLLTKFTPDRADTVILKIVGGLKKFIAFITNFFGWLSLSKTKKGTAALESPK